MSEKIIGNWNDLIHFYPNKKGRKIFREYYKNLGLSAPRFHGAKGIEISLWQAAAIFGPYLYNGCESPFLGMDFTLRRMV